jgi:hypothetical protein
MDTLWAHSLCVRPVNILWRMKAHLIGSQKCNEFIAVVAENNADLGRRGQDLQHRAGQEDERVSCYCH